jgi:hypothetical protein
VVSGPPPAPFAFVAYGMAFVGAALLILTPFLPMAHLELLGESIVVRPGLGGGGWGVVLCGVAAAAIAGLAIARHNPVWATAEALVGVAAIGWSGWYSLIRLPELARLADSASLGWGGLAFVTAGPILIVAALAALIAARPPSTD